jgi:enoyl-[acyl-carrier protein] reductase II
MLSTRLCELLGIEYPVIQAAMSPNTTPELVAAVSNAGGLGSIGAGMLSPADFRYLLARTRELTQRPFAVNWGVPMLNEEAFVFTLDAKPALVSFSLRDPGDLVKRAHDAGIPVMHQVTTVQQARQAAEHGVDVIVAQGNEAGGFVGPVAGLVLIPQVVDAVSPIPVVAAGGIADGRGLAAALVLGAQGINIGTRFLASAEAQINTAWKRAIVAAESEDASIVEVWNDFFAPASGDYGTVARALSSPFIEQWRYRRDDAKREAERLRGEVMVAGRQGRLGELLPSAGQSVGLIRDILPAAEIVRRIVAEAEEALKHTTRLLG